MLKIYLICGARRRGGSEEGRVRRGGLLVPGEGDGEGYGGGEDDGEDVDVGSDDYLE